MICYVYCFLIIYFAFAKYVRLFLFEIAKLFILLPFNCFLRDCFALKWLNPGARAKILPFFVTFKRLVNDLFVFILIKLYLYFWNPLIFLYCNSWAFWTFFVSFGNFEILSYKMKNTIKSFFKKRIRHIFRSS
jgi:hypothetical protein